MSKEKQLGFFIRSKVRLGLGEIEATRVHNADKNHELSFSAHSFLKD
jgi:hypothetical protein